MQKLEISKIRYDAETQIRKGINGEVVEHYAEQMRVSQERYMAFGAVDVFFDGAFYWLADGHHRIEAAKKAEYAFIQAEIREGSKRDAFLFGIEANRKHGLLLSKADRMYIVERLVKEMPEMSNRALAEKIGCSDMTVKRYRDAMSTATFVAVEKRVGKDGRERPAKVTKKTPPTVSAKTEEIRPDVEPKTATPLPAPLASLKFNPLEFSEPTESESLANSLTEYRDEANDAQNSDHINSQLKADRIDKIIEVLGQEFNEYCEISTLEEIDRNAARWARMLLDRVGVDDMREAIKRFDAEQKKIA